MMNRAILVLLFLLSAILTATLPPFIKDLLKKIHITEEKLSGIGVGSPGTVDAKNGIVLYSNNFNWENIPLAEELGKYFACKIRISNDANCAALGEVMAGAAMKIKNAVLITQA